MRLPGSKKSSVGASTKSPPPPGAPPPGGRPTSFPATGTVRAGGPPPGKTLGSVQGEEFIIDLKRRREQLVARVAELQWDLGGLTYEMAIRNSIRVEVLVKRAAELQDADAELNEVERILRMEESATAGACPNCGAPHSSGATFCWQCGKPLLEQVSGDTIVRG
ncbi:MAG TPA: zinc ribbon domain-containing protein [Solirubrobacterales bacterium]|nr:zinc ribbon domain-containing protein [Solirubrobacterales bacterium]